MHGRDDEVLEVDGVVVAGGDVPAPVAPPARALAPRPPLALVAQVAAVAATGFAAGAMSAAAFRAMRTRRPLAPGGAAEPLALPGVVVTRTFLVQVHTITPRD